MNIGDRVRLLREKKGMTQEELATQLGYKSKSSVTHIERGRDIPRSMVVKLADILDTTPAYLMGWEDKSVSQGEKIRLLREQMSLSQSDLALKTGYPLESIIKYENDERKISDTVRHKFIEALQIDEDLLPHCGGYFDFRDDIDIAIAGDAWRLNDIGKRKVLEYISDLIDTGKYNKEE